MKWTNETKEQLYKVAKNNDASLKSLSEVTESAPEILKLASEFGDEPKPILFMLAKMGFFSIDKRTSYKTGVFYKRDNKANLEDFSIHPLFERLPSNISDELELELGMLIKEKASLKKTLELLSEKFAISELNVTVELYKAGLLKYTNGKGYEFSDRAHLEECESVLDTISQLKPSEDLKSSINKYRGEASKLYQV